jgi:hypothetical protein
MHYRDIWKKHFGDIPKDAEGRPFEIHHKDGDRSNNSIQNLTCVSIKEHHQIHLEQGDYGAAMLIAKRMGVPHEDLSKIQKGKKRPELVGKSGPKKGNIPWNKGIKGYELNCNRTNKRHSSKISAEDVYKIRTDFLNNVSVPNIENIGKNAPNGIKITYKILFTKEYAKKFNLTATAIKKIINNETWKDGVIDARNKRK